MTSSRSGRAVRWSAPLAIVAVIAALSVLVPALTAQAKPNLPPMTAADLLAKAQRAKVDALSGIVRLTTSLGLPSLGSFGGRGGVLTDLLSGSHEARVWRDGPDRARVALLGRLAETDWVHNGRDVWMWQSDGRRATHLQLPAADPAREAAEVHQAEAADTEVAATPDQLAQRLLAAVTPSTAVSVRAPEYVAGRPAYGLTLRPKSPTSLVDAVKVAVDAATGLPIAVQVLARGHANPAVDLAFTSLSIKRPAPDLFTFRAPPHSVVTETTNPRSFLTGARHAGRERWRARHHRGARETQGAPEAAAAPDASAQQRPTVVGTAWDQVVIVKGAKADARFDALLKSATRVTGPFGSGRLVRTSLLSAILLDDGRLAAGAVTPQALEAALATVR
jgi:hypothetical protein